MVHVQFFYHGYFRFEIQTTSVPRIGENVAAALEEDGDMRNYNVKEVVHYFVGNTHMANVILGW